MIVQMKRTWWRGKDYSGQAWHLRAVSDPRCSMSTGQSQVSKSRDWVVLEAGESGREWKPVSLGTWWLA